MPHKLYDKLYFFGPMSLGDNFVYSGALHHFADSSNEVHLPVKPIYKDTLSTLYQDYSNIIIAPIENFPTDEINYIKRKNLSSLDRLPIFGLNINGSHVSPLWDMQIYHFLQLPYSLRYSNFRLPKEIKESDNLYNELIHYNENYILVATGRGDIGDSSPIALTEVRKHYNLSENIKIITIDSLSNNMMHYVKLIQNAAEIHCVPSAFYCLVENMHKYTSAKLFFHANRANTLMNVSSVWNNYRWNIIEYATKL